MGHICIAITSLGNYAIEWVLADGYEVIEAPLPVLITVGNELGELRLFPSKS